MEISIRKKIRFIIRWMNLYPPYIGAGIRVGKPNADLTHFSASMKLTWYNKNLVGSHFGGSLYSMCDPFYVFIVLSYVGSDYIVWDKRGGIDFLSPGIDEVKAEFIISKERLKEIKAEVDENGKGVFQFYTTIYHTKDKSIVARVRKNVYVRRKDFKKK